MHSSVVYSEREDCRLSNGLENSPQSSLALRLETFPDTCLSSTGSEAEIHNHYVRNYMLHMPFTHRSTLTMNTNRFIWGGVGVGRENAFDETGIISRYLNVDYLSLGLSLLR